MRHFFRYLLVMLLALSLSVGASSGTNAQSSSSYFDSIVERLERMHGGDLSALGAGGGGDDQQDDQQGGGGGGTVTKTFELELTGEVPADEAFATLALTFQEPDVLVITAIEFCGDLPDISEDLAALEAELEAEGLQVEVQYIQNNDACTAMTYSQSVQLPQGADSAFAFFRLNDDNPEGIVFHEGEEVLDTNLTNSAFFNFTPAGGDKQDDQQDGTGAGDDQQDDQQDGTGAGGDDQQDDQQDDTGAGDDQQDDTQDGTGAGDDQQDDTGAGGDDQQDGTGAGGDDQQDDQQDDSGAGDDQQDDSDLPTELPETGAGGMTAGSAVLGNVLAIAALLTTGGFALRRRK
ncbi:MAG: LPXTG cell wall anchor domain-containing protein [Chloroflexota bacterium]|nr:LPXTG cell wall anchor domain-containing protein [Chloroflexota bacterium]